MLDFTTLIVTILQGSSIEMSNGTITKWSFDGSKLANRGQPQIPQETAQPENQEQVAKLLAHTVESINSIMTLLSTKR